MCLGVIRKRARSSSGSTGAGLNTPRCSTSPPIKRVATRAISSRPNTPNHLIDFRKLVEQNLFLTFGQAAGDDHGAHLAGPLAFEHLLDHADRFLAGRVDEAAGVDHDEVGRLGIGNDGEPVLSEQAEHPLGIDQVLRATKG